MVTQYSVPITKLSRILYTLVQSNKSFNSFTKENMISSIYEHIIEIETFNLKFENKIQKLEKDIEMLKTKK